MKNLFLILSIISIIALFAGMISGYYLEHKGDDMKNREGFVKFHGIFAGITAKLALITLVIGFIAMKKM